MTDEPRHSTKELLRMLRGKSGDVIPPGWYSSRQIREAGRFSEGYVNKVIRDMRAVGHILETRQYKVEMATRGAYPVPHYRLSPEAARLLGLTTAD